MFCNHWQSTCKKAELGRNMLETSWFAVLLTQSPESEETEVTLLQRKSWVSILTPLNLHTDITLVSTSPKYNNNKISLADEKKAC